MEPIFYIIHTLHILTLRHQATDTFNKTQLKTHIKFLYDSALGCLPGGVLEQRNISSNVNLGIKIPILEYRQCEECHP
jgi:hypothetical protein